MAESSLVYGVIIQIRILVPLMVIKAGLKK